VEKEHTLIPSAVALLASAWPMLPILQQAVAAVGGDGWWRWMVFVSEFDKRRAEPVGG